MQFTYHKDSGQSTLTIDGDLHKYLFKVRRVKIDTNLFLRNLNDDNLYEYEIVNCEKRQTQLNLISSEKKIIKQNKSLHIGWCVVDPKTIEKALSSLNELGIEKISFIYCQYSQKQFKLNFDKLNKILINSSQQCGRSNLMSLALFDSLDDFLKAYPDTFMFNFSNNHIDTKKEKINTIVIGCEGGFSPNETGKIKEEKIVGIDSNLILRSETAVLSVASKIIL
ncbi:MAG: 16S rRNA (uracil(1498)-N(3))-methyltransferase [Arcobacteraceae bacterium]|nr:16S rRNA (uracil(1498)-N(3))-methyltransferase [Arcobacteraceae bacterium]